MNSNRATKYFHHVILILFNKTVINCIRGTQIQIDCLNVREKSGKFEYTTHTHVKMKLKYQKKENMKN